MPMPRPGAAGGWCSRAPLHVEEGGPITNASGATSSPRTDRIAASAAASSVIARWTGTRRSGASSPIASREAAIETSSWRATPSAGLSAAGQGDRLPDGLGVEVRDRPLEILGGLLAEVDELLERLLELGGDVAADAGERVLDAALLLEHRVQELRLLGGGDVVVLIRAAARGEDGRGAGRQGRAGCGEQA